MAEADRSQYGEQIPEVAREPRAAASEVTFPNAAWPGSSPELQLRQAAFPSWTFWDVLSILGATAAAIFLCSSAGLALAHRLPAYRHQSLAALAQTPLIIVGSQLASYPIVIAFMAAIIRRRSGESFLHGIRWSWPMGKTLRFCLFGIALAFCVEGLAHFLPIPKSLPMDKFFNDAGSAYLMAFFGVAVAPLLEELFFRGMLYPILRRGLGITTALALTAAAFAAIHGAQLGYAWAPILSIFVVGLVLTLVREYTDSVAACFLTHSGYNFVLFTLLWFGTDHYRHLEKLNV